MRKKAKILYLITQSEWGGAQRYVFDLATGLSDEYEILVACGAGGPLIEKLKEKNIPVVVLHHLVRPIRPLTDVQALLEIRALIKRERPDIVHTNSSKAEIVGNLAAWICKVPVVFTAHGFVFLGYNGSLGALKARVYVLLERLANWKTKKIICVSEYDRQGGLDKRIIHSDKLVTIHNGISLYRAEQHTPKKGWNNDERIIIGVIANLYKKKGIDYLIRAIARLNQHYQHLACWVLGDGQERKPLETLITALSVENVKLLGFQKDTNRYLHQFDMFVLPSLKEGFPYVILEAMAAGLPVIATRTAGIPEAIDDGAGGFIVEPGDVEALAEKIALLASDATLRTQMGAYNRKRVQAEFSLEKMMEATKKVYGEV